MKGDPVMPTESAWKYPTNPAPKTALAITIAGCACRPTMELIDTTTMMTAVITQ